MISKKFIPLIVLSCLLAMPVIFLTCLNMNFHIVKFSSPNMNDLRKLLDFGILIFQNIGKRSMKSEVWSSIIYSFIPVLVLIAIFLTNKKSTSHGKARWSEKKDIETYEYSFKKLCYDFLALFNPLNLIPPTKYIKKIKSFFRFGLIGKIYPIGVNFDKGFLLGNFKDVFKLKKVYYNAPLSTFIVAPPGAGKSAAVIIPNLLHIPTSCVVTDIKGELCDKTAGYRQQVLGNKIYIFNPFGDDNNVKFNPFDNHCVKDLNFNQINRLVKEIANTIFVAEKGTDSHWIESAKNLFIFHALYDICCKKKTTFFDIARATKKDYFPLIEEDSPYAKQAFETNDDESFKRDDKGKKVRNLDVDAENLWFRQCGEQKFTDCTLEENFMDLTNEQIQQIAEEKGYEILDDIVRDYARALASVNDKEFASIKSTFNRTMDIFNNYQVRDATDGMSFQYEDLRQENITLYIKIAQTDIGTLAPLIRILLESIAKNLMIKESNKIEERIYMLLDEFIRFGKLEFLTEAPALCRSYNLVPVYVTQDFAMVEKYYSKEDLRIMNGTIAYRILFRMNDFESAEAVSKEIGNYTRDNRSYSTSGTKFFETGGNFSKEGYALITAQDILNIPNDEIIITATGNKAKPLKLKAFFYYKHKKELDKLKIKFDYKKQEELVAKELAEKEKAKQIEQANQAKNLKQAS